MRVTGVFSRNNYLVDTKLTNFEIREEIKERIRAIIKYKLTAMPLAIRLSDDTPVHVELDDFDYEFEFTFDRIEVRR